jgi:hypothetical protein
MIFVFYALPLIALLNTALPAGAHSGSVALAHPVKGIGVDGDLADWPQGLPVYTIDQLWRGEQPTGQEDFEASFHVGYNAAQNALYLAVEVTDDSLVTDQAGEGRRRGGDGCQIGVVLVHRSGLGDRRWIRRGDSRRPGDVGVVVAQHGEPKKQIYEWRIDLKDSTGTVLVPGDVVGFDVVVLDADGEGRRNFSRMKWGGSRHERDRLGGRRSNRRGDLLLMDRGQALGALSGTVAWRHSANQEPPQTAAVSAFGKTWHMEYS